MFRSGKTASEILRHFATTYQDMPEPELMRLFQEAFDLPYESTLCVGGWWFDGSGELSDQQLDSFLMPAIRVHTETRDVERWDGTLRKPLRASPPLLLTQRRKTNGTR
jgi:hypothetical protein